jgi:filamentous hemagglutinin family protein
MALAVASCFAGTAQANPTAPTVVHGAATFQQAGNLLSITNSPGTIINWGSFSIAANEVTRFIQQSQASTVLNRVIGQDPSSILGALQSNGRVFLINPNGILFGAGAQIDVAGLVASTLNLSNADFLAGRLNFTEAAGAGSIVNQGAINAASGGQVYLVAPDITNSGIIRSPQGEVVLAAGKSVELVNPGTPNLRVEISAPDNAARNLGQIVADSGRIGIYAGLINHSGTIRADSAQVTEDGRIVLRATQNATLESGSVTSANGPAGGRIEVQAGNTTLVSGALEAKGTAGPGGTLHVLGNLVGLTGSASLDASGEAGGGTVLVGGDFQGGNPQIPNAFRTYVGPDTSIKADAITGGDGGRVIVWSDDATRAYGAISARGGAQAGNGGFVEVSGKRWLDFNATVDTRAPKGSTGSLLLDPNNVVINEGPDSLDGGNFSGGDPNIFSSGSDGNSQISWGTIQSHLASANVYITTQGDTNSGTATLTVATDSPILNTPNTLRLISHGDVDVSGRILNNGAGALQIYAGWNGLSATTPVVTAGVGDILIRKSIELEGNLRLTAGRDVRIQPTATGLVTSGSVDRSLLISAHALDVIAGRDILVAGGEAMVTAFGGATASVDASTTVSAATTITMTAAGDITIRGGDSTQAVAGVACCIGGNTGVNSATAVSSVTLGAGDAVTMNGNTITIRGGDNVLARASRNGVGVGGVNTGTANAEADAAVNAGGNLSLTAGTAVMIRGGDSAVVDAATNGRQGQGSGTATVLSRATVAANNDIAIDTGALTIRGGNWLGGSACCNGSFGGNGTGIAVGGVSVLVSAGRDLVVNAGGAVTIAGGDSAGAGAGYNGSYGGQGTGSVSLDTNVRVTAGRHVDITAAALTVRGGDWASASAQGNGASDGINGIGTTNINASALLEAGGNMALTVVGGPVEIRGGDSGFASAQDNAKWDGSNGRGTSTVNVSTTVSATGNLTVSAASLTIRGGDSAGASACCNGLASVGGTNEGTALVNASVTVDSGQDMTLTVSTGPLVIRGGDWGWASACCNGNYIATGTGAAEVQTGAQVTAGRDLFIHAAGSTVEIRGGQGAEASICCNGGSGAQFGAGTALVSTNASVSATRNLELTASTLTIAGGSLGEVFACCNGSAGGIDGNGIATVNANAFLTTGSNMTLTVTGAVEIRGGDSTFASACCNGGSGNGGGTATIHTNATVSAGDNLTVQSGSLTVRGGDFASASACCNGSGAGNGTAAARIHANAALSAGEDMTLTVTGGPVLVRGGASSFAGACCNGQDLGQGEAAASVTANATVSAGNNLTVTAGSLVVAGGDGNFAFASSNGLNGAGIGEAGITANATIFSSNVLSITANSVAVRGGDDAFAFAGASASASIVGTNTASVTVNSLVQAEGPLQINAGSLDLRGGIQSVGHQAQTSGPGVNSATTLASASVIAADNFNFIYSGGAVNVLGGTARSLGSGGNSAIADASFLIGGNASMNVTGAFAVTNGAVTGTGTAVALLGGTGTVTINGGSGTLTNDGIVRPGGSIGTLSVVGNYTQGANGVLAIELEGASVGQYDVLAVSGTANLGGTLNVSYLGGYVPAEGASHPVVTYGASTGTFATINDPYAQTPTYGATVFSLGGVGGGGGVITWDGGAGTFNWLDLLNWSSDTLPGPTDAVIINVLGTPVTLASGTHSIKSLTSSESLIVSGGSLTMAEASSITGTLTLSGGTVAANGGLTTAGLNMSSGTLGGLGNLVVTNSYARTGGTIGADFSRIDITQASGNLLIAHALSAAELKLAASAGNLIIASGTALNAPTGITLTGANIQSDGNLTGPLYAAATGGGSIVVTNATGLTAQSVTTAGGAVDITVNAGDLDIPGQINAGSGPVTLSVPAGSVNGTGTSPDIIGGTLDIAAGVNIMGSGGLHTDVAQINSLVATSGFIDVASFRAGGVTFGNVQAAGDVTLTSVGPLSILPVGGNTTASAGGAMLLSGTAIALGSASQTANLDVSAAGGMTIEGTSLTVSAGASGYTFAQTGSGSMQITATGNVTVAGGAGAGSYAILYGNPDVNLTVGGVIHLNGGGGGSGGIARIQSASPTSINVTFTNPGLTGGGFFVNGTEGALSSGGSGFFVGDIFSGPFPGGIAAAPGAGFNVTYAGGGLGSIITEQLTTLILSPQLTATEEIIETLEKSELLPEEKTVETAEAAMGPQEERQSLPLCR